ncbi:hypothetical protein SYNTR_1458 [Candidatus Syntrophocurvum alkaliphilum]|uniref:DUF4321 domain-containing protein n=1 Tax=Candidatus Syntrophocurvum alkaliphilum TaxID=2293317 RepID=A0A6I6DLM9_9FIRM|nr:DUF4321 domain-containing protein [Candidatus Syntrophocurvum alkaliphilum]QGU00052.1 hypothetical protein SYNTR_1458 [Candidatus Syntrophocurvum alkaliphilum]
MGGRSRTSWQILLLLLAIGGIVGGFIGDAIVKLWPQMNILGNAQSVGLPPFTMDLQVFTLTFGFMLHINIFTIIGFILAFLAFRKL